MKCIVDTHVLLWSFIEPERLSVNIREILLNDLNEIYYSPVNLWEISIKYGLKKLFLNGLTPETFLEELNKSYYTCMAISNSDLITSYQLPIYHKDPFDRLLIWISIRNKLTLMSVDNAFEPYTQHGLNIAN
jgi:PIN domain nuclease of toxin-antitoxin system